MTVWMKANIVFNKFCESDGRFCGIEYTDCVFSSLEQLERVMTDIVAKYQRKYHLVYEWYVDSIENL